MIDLKSLDPDQQDAIDDAIPRVQAAQDAVARAEEQLDRAQVGLASALASLKKRVALFGVDAKALDAASSIVPYRGPSGSAPVQGILLDGEAAPAADVELLAEPLP